MASADLARNARQLDGRDMTPGEKHRTPPVSEPPLPLLPRTAHLSSNSAPAPAPHHGGVLDRAADVAGERCPRVREDEKRGPALLPGQLHDERGGACRAAARPAVDASQVPNAAPGRLPPAQDIQEARGGIPNPAGGRADGQQLLISSMRRAVRAS